MVADVAPPAPARVPMLALAAVVALALAGLVAVALAGAGDSHAAARPDPFAWLNAGPEPASWKLAATSSGALLAYPPGWRAIQSDAGTASAAPDMPRGAFVGYLNATPKQGKETLANWSRFRVEHVADEGARDVRLGAAASGLHFRGGHGSCVIDSYSTDKARFREVACIVDGARATTVVVAAAPARTWHSAAPVLERAVSTFST
jgi:hypothetical protein